MAQWAVEEGVCCFRFFCVSKASKGSRCPGPHNFMEEFTLGFVRFITLGDTLMDVLKYVSFSGFDQVVVECYTAFRMAKMKSGN